MRIAYCLLGLVFMLGTASAADHCMICGGHGCQQGPIGQNNPDGCFCHYVNKQCQMSGNPCHCEGNQTLGWLCTCTWPTEPKRSSVYYPPVTAEIVRAKWTKIMAKDPPDALEIFHMGSGCADGQEVWEQGLKEAARETKHRIKFVQGGNSESDSLQDKLDEGNQ